MVLQDLGEKILSGLSKLSSTSKVDDAFFNQFINEMVNALRDADVSTHTILKFMKNLKTSIKPSDLPPGISARKIIEREVLKEIVALLDPGVEPFRPEKGRCNVVMMVGLQGAGKTTTCTKLGRYYSRRGWKVAVVGADTFRAGAREQLMQNAQSVGLPYYVDFVNPDPVEVAVTGVRKFREAKFDLIIVDTSGRHMQEASLFAEMQQLEDVLNPDEVIFVLDGTIGQGAHSQALAFSKAVSVGSIIITKLDSSAKGGGALSAVAATGSPIAFYGTGEDMGSLEVFDANSFVSRMLGFGDVAALARKMEEIDMDKQQEIASRIMGGHFGFREMYMQYQTILQMGDLGSLVETMGMGKLLPKEASTEGMAENVKKMLVVIDSMSDKEMDEPELLRDEGRKRRISRGTGVPIEYVQFVIDEQKRWKKIFERLPKASKNLLLKMDQGGGAGMDPRTMQRELGNLTRAIRDPRMMQQLGGQEGLQNIMKMGLGGMPKRK